MTTHGPFHPDTIATTRAHNRRAPASCASDDRLNPGPCDCGPDPADLAEVWAGRARMAGARMAAGQPLDDIDRTALTRTTETR